MSLAADSFVGGELRSVREQKIIMKYRRKYFLQSYMGKNKLRQDEYDKNTLFFASFQSFPPLPHARGSRYALLNWHLFFIAFACPLYQLLIFQLDDLCHCYRALCGDHNLTTHIAYKA